MSSKTILAAMGVSLACGVVIGALGYAKFFVPTPVKPTPVDPVAVYEKLKEAGELLFAEVPTRSEVTIKIPKQFKFFGKVVASDGARVAAKWTGVHLFAVDLKDEDPAAGGKGTPRVKVEPLPDGIRITVPPYVHRLSYLDPGTLEFRTVDGSWFIKDDVRYGVTLRLVQDQNSVNGAAYLQGAEGRAELRKACADVVTGIVHPLVGPARRVEVICPDPT